MDPFVRNPEEVRLAAILTPAAIVLMWYLPPLSKWLRWSGFLIGRTLRLLRRLSAKYQRSAKQS